MNWNDFLLCYAITTGINLGLLLSLVIIEFIKQNRRW
jgi:hypothetical protein